MAMQLALPLETDTRTEAPLRRAWARSGLALPYELALQDRAIAICLRCLADAEAGAHAYAPVSGSAGPCCAGSAIGLRQTRS